MKKICSTVFVFLFLVSTGITAQCTLTVSLTSPSIICIGQTADLIANWASANGVVTISWQWAQGSATGASIAVAPTANTDYTLMVYDVSNPNCYKQIEFTLNVSTCTGVEENIFVNKRLNIYPNPSVDHFEIDCGAVGQKEVMVLDALGRIIHQGYFSGSTTTLDLENAPAGIYSIRLLSGGDVYQGKVVKVGN